ncbi:MAM domain-containing protein 2-like [Nerophis lumbriciformis]|uniref:MAM domain-containing protein 2-like n=1 Tax=Nerophis lumbriciformis TaxID=546530 RepID=UPI003BA9D5CD
MLPFFLLALAATIQAQMALLPGSCSFETDTCGYTSDVDFTSWTLNKNGHFLAVEAALIADQDSDVTADVTGILLSPVLEHSEWSCLRVVYQISGSGSLQVLQRTEGQSFDRPLWSSQEPSDSWIIASMDLQIRTDSSRLVIEGKPGRRAGSSVAVYEIHISPGYCLECDYEESHLCGYNNQWNANVNWYVGSAGGGQLLDNDLPDDHTHNNRTGHFMYVDSIYTKTFKEVAKLVSPMTTVPMSGCLTFHYQRSDEGGNLFSVYTRDRLGQYQELWRVGPKNTSNWSGSHGEWIPVQVDLRAPYSVQVVFEVAFNSPRGGHVAIDDISFSPEFCSSDTEPTFDPTIANCDFESGFCQYTQDQATGSLWRRVCVKPNLFRNGDHTSGAGTFLLAHSQLNTESSYISRLISPTLAANMKYCLRFYFTVRGINHSGVALAVYLQQGSSLEKIWTLGERSRGIWIATDVTFQTSQPAQVVFVSTCRSLWDCGSVALDDISMSLGDCELTAGLTSSIPGWCDFEAGLCDYTQDRQHDAADWERRRGPTPTSYTGPRGDHTTGLGYYLHMEASPMLPGQTVRLLSPPVRGSKDVQCLGFFYNMFGSNTGQLSVRLQNNKREVLLWQRTGEQSVAWLKALVEYQSDDQHQIVLEATRGSSVRSDIAIDDIILESGPCSAAETKAPVGTFNEIE